MKFRLLGTFRELVSRTWWNDRLDDLRDNRSWSFGLSTLLHVALIVSIGSVWMLNEHVSGVAPLDTRWTDITATPVPDDSIEKAWAQPQAATTSGGSQAGSSASFAPARSPRPVEPTSILAGTLPPSWFEDGVSNDELGTELSDLDGWRNRLARIGTGRGQGNGNGNGYGGAFFGMKADGQSVVFVVDSSASMNVHHATAATRFQRLKLELLNSVAGMKPSQSFFIIFFNDEPIPMPSRSLQPARPRQQRYYLEWMARIRARGFTDPLSSLNMALQLRPDVIYFLTDGNFTNKTALQLSRIHQPRSVIHTITFGERAAESLMKSIATANRGTYRFIP